MTNLCTLFDSNYLSRGLALYESLNRVSSSFHLYVVTFDNECYDYLKQYGPGNLTPIKLEEFEDEKLLNVKGSRSSAEYCWTCTPSIILYCIERFMLTVCTYVDADLIFYSDPQVLIDEMGSKSILLTEHYYTKEYDQSVISGRYCVQFMCFKKNEEALTALRWWRNRCLEWCYARAEDNKFGDQKYLDDWTERFSCVYVSKNRGAGVAPWNIQQYHINDNPLALIEKLTGKIFTVIFYHFHGVRVYIDNTITCCGTLYSIDKKAKSAFYFPYFKMLLVAGNLISHNKPLLSNIHGAKGQPPGKTSLVFNFIKERVVLCKMGNISLFNLRLLRFKDHYHFYKLNTVK